MYHLLFFCKITGAFHRKKVPAPATSIGGIIFVLVEKVKPLSMEPLYEPKPRWRRIYENVLVVLLISMAIFLLVSLFFFPGLFFFPLIGILVLGVLRRTYNRRELMVLAMGVGILLMVLTGWVIFSGDFQYFTEPAAIDSVYRRFVHNLAEYSFLRRATLFFLLGFLVFISALFWDSISAKIFGKK